MLSTRNKLKAHPHSRIWWDVFVDFESCYHTLSLQTECHYIMQISRVCVNRNLCHQDSQCMVGGIDISVRIKENLGIIAEILLSLELASLRFNVPSQFSCKSKVSQNGNIHCLQNVNASRSSAEWNYESWSTMVQERACHFLMES